MWITYEECRYKDEVYNTFLLSDLMIVILWYGIQYKHIKIVIIDIIYKAYKHIN